MLVSIALPRLKYISFLLFEVRLLASISPRDNTNLLEEGVRFFQQVLKLCQFQVVELKVHSVVAGLQNLTFCPLQVCLQPIRSYNQLSTLQNILVS